MTSFAELTTFRIGGSIDSFATAQDDESVIDAAREGALIIGGGSNLLTSDAPFDRPVVRTATQGLEVQRDGDRVIVEAAAGESWDDFVAFTVDNGWSGVEAMSGIPGLVGATPIQNVGAYGQDISQVASHVSVLNIASMSIESWTGADCDFRYRSSRLKREGGFIVLSVAFALRADSSASIAYAEVARRLEVEPEARVEVGLIRDAVLELRRSKGMVIDEADPDTRSAGSFFTNPIVSVAQADAVGDRSPSGSACPRYSEGAGVKLSAAWLIEQAGITKGWSLDGRARVSTKHTLAIVNASGDASAQDVLELARAIRQRVQDAFDVTLEVEPTLIGCAI